MENKRYTYQNKAGILASLFCLSALLSACNNDPVIASVDDVKLTENDAYVLMRHLNYNPDSKDDRDSFIRWWCNNEVIKAEVQQNYPDQWHLIELRSNQFAAELAQILIEETQLVKKEDTIVSNLEIEEYYNLHKEEFVLQDYIVKALYFKIPVGVDYKKEKIQSAFLLKNDKDLMKVNSYAKLYAENYHFNDSNWVYFSEVSKDIPVNKYNVDNLVLNRSKTYFSDDKFVYFINVMDFKLKDEAPPLEFLEKEIRNIIVAERLQENIEKRRGAFIEQLKKKHEITIH